MAVGVSNSSRWYSWPTKEVLAGNSVPPETAGRTFASTAFSFSCSSALASQEAFGGLSTRVFGLGSCVLVSNERLLWRA